MAIPSTADILKTIKKNPTRFGVNTNVNLNTTESPARSSSALPSNEAILNRIKSNPSKYGVSDSAVGSFSNVFTPTTTPTPPIVSALEEKKGFFSKLSQGVKDFFSEVKTSGSVTDNVIKSQLKGTLSLLSKDLADIYQRDTFTGKLIANMASVPIPPVIGNFMGKNLDIAAQELRESAVKDLKITEEYMKQNPLAVDASAQPFLNKIKDPKWVARGLTLNVPSFVASLGSAAVVTLLTKNPAAGYVAGFGTAFSLEAGDSYNTALDAGVEEKKARLIATAVGGINGMLETIFPAKKAVGLLGGGQVKRSFIKNLTTKITEVIVEEAIPETLQEIISNVGRKTYAENVNILEGTPEAAFFGFLIGGITSTIIPSGGEGEKISTGQKESVVITKEEEAIATPEGLRTLEQQKIADDYVARTQSEIDAKKVQEGSAQKTEIIPKIGTIETKLSSALGKAKPRYNHGTKAFIPSFESDIDLALYITAQTRKSKSDAQYRSFLQKAGFSNQQINEAGPKVRAYIKSQSIIKEGGTSSKPETILVPNQELLQKPKETVVVKEIPTTPKETTPTEIKRQTETINKISAEKISTAKNIKDVRAVLKDTKTALNEAIIEAEGKAVVAQEIRANLNTDNIAKLKRIYAVNQKFREGDVETIRKSKSGNLVNNVIENVQESYPDMSEQDAFDFAINLPNKADEKAVVPNKQEAIKKAKELSKYLDQLREKQKELGLKENDVLTKEWREALETQEKLKKMVGMSGALMPVGEGKTKASRLMARAKGILKTATAENIEKFDLLTYNRSNQDKQLDMATEFVVNNEEEALKVLTGEIDPPSGMLRNAVYLALKAAGADNAELALKVASAASTRAGQEISILQKLDPNNPVTIIENIIKNKVEVFEKRTGKKVKDKVKKGVEEINADQAIPNAMQWSKFLESIRC